MNPFRPIYKGGKPVIVFWWREWCYRAREAATDFYWWIKRRICRHQFRTLTSKYHDPVTVCCKGCGAYRFDGDSHE